MKKIFTILFCAAIASSSFSQTTAGTKKYKAYNSHSSQHNNIIVMKSCNKQIAYAIDPRSDRDLEINKINYINNIQVQQVINNKDLGIWDKRDALDALEFQRVQQVNVVYQKYSDSVTAYTAQQINNSFGRNKQ